MFDDTFFNNQIRKYIIVFGTIFNNLKVVREFSDQTQTLPVPLTYGPKDKVISRYTNDPNLDKKVALNVPVMGFEITGFNYDGRRHRPATSKIVRNTLYAFQPVTYSIFFNLYVTSKNSSDCIQIIEQILPYFKPEWSVNIKLIDGIESIDTPITLRSCSMSDTYEGHIETERNQIWTLQFEVQAHFFSKISRDGDEGYSALIRNIDVSLIGTDEVSEDVDVETWSDVEHINIKPGQTANGVATSNASLSVDYLSVDPSMPFGFIEVLSNNT
jgi:hypothetical protein